MYGVYEDDMHTRPYHASQVDSGDQRREQRVQHHDKPAHTHDASHVDSDGSNKEHVHQHTHAAWRPVPEPSMPVAGKPGLLAPNVSSLAPKVGDSAPNTGSVVRSGLDLGVTGRTVMSPR